MSDQAPPTLLERAWHFEQARYLIESGAAHLIVIQGRNPTVNAFAQRLQRFEAMTRARRQFLQGARRRDEIIQTKPEEERWQGPRIELVDERGQPLKL